MKKKTDRRLRDLGRRLARPRDIVVQVQTFRILGTRLSRELPAGLLERVRDVGEQLRSKLDEKSVEKELRRTARALRQLRRRLRKFPVKHGRRAIGKGITRTYRRARRALANVHADPTPERFHEWRKRVKLLSNELKIIGPAVPELATRYAPKVEKLGEILGQVHDSRLRRRDRPSATHAGSDRTPIARRCAGWSPSTGSCSSAKRSRWRWGCSRGGRATCASWSRHGWKTWRTGEPQVDEVADKQAA